MSQNVLTQMSHSNVLFEGLQCCCRNSILTELVPLPDCPVVERVLDSVACGTLFEELLAVVSFEVSDWSDKLGGRNGHKIVFFPLVL